MATQLQLRRGTTAENNDFTGGAGEVTVDTQTHALRVHDGSTLGGFQVDTVVFFQRPTVDNNYIWVRKYASGWVEMGGYTSGSGTWGIENIVFPVEMANIYYTLTITGDSSTNDYDSTEAMVKRAGTRSCACNRSTTGFDCQSHTIVTWEVKGLAA